jgi:hypothetical protein
MVSGYHALDVGTGDRFDELAEVTGARAPARLAAD